MTRNIIIKNLDQDKILLIEEIKEMTGEKTATKAIWSALQEYIAEKEKIKKLQSTILDLIA